jgi:uncharacterized protein
LSPDDDAVVASQLGRPPRGRWRVAARCEQGAPLVIAQAPSLEDGSPFPTTFWLTCPRLVEAVGELESAGEGARLAQRAASDAEFAAALTAADAAYRDARRAEGGGADPCEGVGVAGQLDPLAVKCLHARLAAHLAGVPDPIGEEVAGAVRGRLSGACGDARCHARAAAGC